jgi:hypothetical protein
VAGFFFAMYGSSIARAAFREGLHPMDVGF